MPDNSLPSANVTVLKENLVQAYWSPLHLLVRAVRLLPVLPESTLVLSYSGRYCSLL